MFAAGNVMSAANGMTYGGPGGTLGPALTFGYRTGRALAQPRESSQARDQRHELSA